MSADPLESLEVELLLEGVYKRYGWDFRDYAYASMRRRLLQRTQEEGHASITELLARVLHEPACMARLLVGLTVHSTAMFRDPSFFRALRERVLPLLRTYPSTRIWVAGCSTGEEVYSLAIVLAEVGLTQRHRIYATDLSDDVLAIAKRGIYPLAAMREYTKNYLEAGGERAFSEYYTADGEHAIMRTMLRERVVFSEHNLAIDGSFNEFNLVLCRNVMIYFKRVLQERVLKLLDDSLSRNGVLALGRSESLQFTPLEGKYEALDEVERIYRKSND